MFTWAILFGHLAADYLLQTKTMAIRKSEKTREGLAWCLCHCAVYSVCICLSAWEFNLLLFTLVFLSHYPIDRYSLADKWLKLIKGRDFGSAYESKDRYREFDIAFTCLVYAVTDNTMHLVLLYVIFAVL